MGFTREAESPCPRVEGPTPQLATKHSLVPGVLFFFQAEDGIRDAQESRGLGDVYKRQEAESPCQRVEGPTPQLATKRSLVPGVLFFFRWYRHSLVPHTKTKTIFSTLKPRLVEHACTRADGRILFLVCIN